MYYLFVQLPNLYQTATAARNNAGGGRALPGRRASCTYLSRL